MNMRKIIALAVAVLVGFSSVFAAMPERIPHNVEKYKKICRENIQKVKKGMYREPKGSLKHKFITPGCDAYLDNLWDWDSWLSGIALCQIMLETGNKADFNECMEYQKGCIYNALDYCGLEGYIPIIIAPDSLLPMWAGLATPQQAREMVERNYLDERIFNAPAGVYTLAPTEKRII